MTTPNPRYAILIGNAGMSPSDRLGYDRTPLPHTWSYPILSIDGPSLGTMCAR